jgi:hypothetical protein
MPLSSIVVWNHCTEQPAAAATASDADDDGDWLTGWWLQWIIKQIHSSLAPVWTLGLRESKDPFDWSRVVDAQIVTLIMCPTDCTLNQVSFWWPPKGILPLSPPRSPISGASQFPMRKGTGGGWRPSGWSEFMHSAFPTAQNLIEILFSWKGWTRGPRATCRSPSKGKSEAGAKRLPSPPTTAKLAREVPNCQVLGFLL